MIVVLADDLTGAAEVAGAAFQAGLSAEVHIGRLHPSDCDVVVVDADTRSCLPAVAAAKIGQLAHQARRTRPEFVFKKVDSLLRGPVLAEVDAVRHALGLRQCLLVCGNPRKGRTVVDGRIWIEGRPLRTTRLADDPEHPRHSDHVLDLMRGGSPDAAPSEVGTGGLDCVLPGQISGATTCVGQALAERDLDRHAECWKDRRDSVLAAGASEFFEALLRKYTGIQPAALPPRHAPMKLSLATGSETLLISGSRMSTLKDWPLVRVDSDCDSSECVSRACQTLAQQRRAALRATDLPAGSPEDRLGKLTDIAGRVLATCRPEQVWIEGGRMASTLIRALGHERLIPMASAGDGIVSLRAARDVSPRFVIKPGSYPWPVIESDQQSMPSGAPIQETA